MYIAKYMTIFRYYLKKLSIKMLVMMHHDVEIFSKKNHAKIFKDFYSYVK